MNIDAWGHSQNAMYYIRVDGWPMLENGLVQKVCDANRRHLEKRNKIALTSSRRERLRLNDEIRREAGYAGFQRLSSDWLGARAGRAQDDSC